MPHYIIEEGGFQVEKKGLSLGCVPYKENCAGDKMRGAGRRQARRKGDVPPCAKRGKLWNSNGYSGCEAVEYKRNKEKLKEKGKK